MDVDEEPDDPESWHADAYITNANYQAKKMVFLLFINRMESHSFTFVSSLTLTPKIVWSNPLG
jgi:hypothetical protein